jgi:hypothetical protein
MIPKVMMSGNFRYDVKELMTFLSDHYRSVWTDYDGFMKRGLAWLVPYSFIFIGLVVVTAWSVMISSPYRTTLLVLAAICGVAGHFFLNKQQEKSREFLGKLASLEHRWQMANLIYQANKQFVTEEQWLVLQQHVGVEEVEETSPEGE